MEKQIEKLITLLENSVSACHTVLAVESQLMEEGFTQLHMSEPWNLKANGKYYMKHQESSLFAFTIGQDLDRDVPVRMSACHTDFPGLSIKAIPQVDKCGYTQLNVEVYGGVILSTWMDRPLSAAGRVALRSSNPFKPEIRIVDLQDPFCTIPNLAIHMNREVNNGVALNRQTDMMPIAGLSDMLNENESFLTYLAGKLEVPVEDILDFQLQLYATDKSCLMGMHQELLGASHLDNTTSVLAMLEGITGEPAAHGVNLAAFFDNEEVGSRTSSGAASSLLSDILRKIIHALGEPEDVLYDSILLSVDVAHGIHPNHPNKADVTLQPVLGKGFCIKEACSQSYATQSKVVAVVQQICDMKGIPYQKFANRSDIAGGGTLGNISSAHLPVGIVDIGVPILAMHSIREVMGCADMKALSDCVDAFYHM